MSAFNGPTRMMLINCGKYSFADVDLTAPVHLVGPNNVGKTSLIALLQFLYLDDQRQMHFSRSLAETRQYYFPDPYSYVLFELMTPTGFQVLGVRGLGPLKQFEFERFSFRGRLERAHFIAENGQVNEVDEIRAKLSEQGWVRLDPKHLRAALTGVGDARGVELGLVPVRSQKDYESFRSLFCNILRLSHMKQDELKQQLLDLYKGDFKQRSINLSEKYADGLEKVRRDAHEVLELKQLESDIDNLLRHSEQRDSARRTLPALWDAIGSNYEQTKQNTAKQIAALTEALQGVDADTMSAEGERDKMDVEARQCDQAVGKLQAELEALERDRAELADYVPEWVDERMRTMQAEDEHLTAALDRASQDEPERMNRRLLQQQTQAVTLRQRISDTHDALITTLRQSLDDNELQTLFTLINPDLLGVPLKTLQMTPEQALELARWALKAKASDGEWTLGNHTFIVPQEHAPALDKYSDMATMQTELDDLEHGIKTVEQAIDASRQAEALRARRENVRGEHKVLTVRQSNWQRLQEKENRAQQWMTDLTAEQDRRKALTQSLRENEEMRAKLQEKRRLLDTERQSSEQARDALAARVRELRPPSSEWEHHPLVFAGDVNDLLEQYERERSNEANEHERVIELLSTINQRTYGRYETEDEAETIALLRGQKESIPDREKSVEDLWTGIATAVRKHLKDLHGDVDMLKARVSALNRRLTSVSISNLKALRLEVDERPRWMSLLSNAMRQEDMPLFSVGNDADEALREIGKLFAEHPSIDLADLFDLHFDVETSEGNHNRYDHLDNIESNGTTITIKVLINLILLRELLANDTNRTPFYLDECTSLDEANLRAIVEEAASLGFCAVLASPDAMGVAERLYFIEEQDGRVHLDPDTSMVRLTHG